METDHGEVVVMVLGDRQKPVAITYHDVGANCELPMHEVRLLARYLVRNENREFMSLRAITLHHNTVHILVMLAGDPCLLCTVWLWYCRRNLLWELSARPCDV